MKTTIKHQSRVILKGAQTLPQLAKLPPQVLNGISIGLAGSRAIMRRHIAAMLAEMVSAVKEVKRIEHLKIAEEGPIAKVLQICEEMKGQPRKDVIAACLDKGINPHTASTQYQKWFASTAH